MTNSSSGSDAFISGYLGGGRLPVSSPGRIGTTRHSLLAAVLCASVLLSGATLNAQEEGSCSPALYFLSRGDYGRALDSARTEDDGTPAARLNVQGVAEMMNGRAGEAAAKLRASLAADPSYTPARFNLGVALLRQGLFQEAAAELERVYASGGNLAGNAAYHRGLTADGSGDLPGAVEWFEKAIAADSSLSDAHLQLGYIYEKTGQLQLAGRSYRRYLEHHPESPAGLLRFGIAAQRAGHIETARRYLRLVTDVAPHSPEAVEARKFLVIWD